MKSKKNTGKAFILLTFLVVMFFSLETVFAQCGTYFKTGYRKMLDTNFGKYELEDWNNDGKLDFWKFNYNQNTSSQDIYAYLNNGAGEWNWSNPQIYPTAIPAFHSNGYDRYYLFDFEGDGDKDIFSVRQLSFHTIHRNNGNGTFSEMPTRLYDDGQVMWNIGFFDVNGDNLRDWVHIANKPGVGNPFAYRPANADGTYGALTVIFNLFSPSQINNVGDFNGDGKTDFIIYDSGYKLVANNGNGTFTLGGVIASTEPVYFFDVADFNGDGRTDILSERGGDTGGSAPRTFYVFYGQTNGTFNRSAAVTNDFIVPRALLRNKIGDFNGDSTPDFIEYGDYSAGLDATAPAFYSVFLNDGAGGFTRTDYRRALGQERGMVFADLNGDGKTDIFVRERDGSYLNNIFGEQVINIQYNQCRSFGEVKKLNFNGNDRDDFVLWNSSTGEWRAKDVVWYQDGESTYRTFNWGLGSLGDTPAPGDFDGDGRTDYAVYRNGEGNWYIYGSSTGWLTIRFGLPGDIPIPNDFDGGGRTDVAVFRPSDGNWYILSSETQQFTALHFGANGDRPVPSDYDGDDKTDVAVYRPSEGNWYYLKSSDGNYAVFHWGIASDTPVPADFDGDGKSDLAVWRGGANGYWFILRSYNQQAGYFPMGKTGDIPLIVYGGGEIATPIVYRPSEWKWYKYEWNFPLYPAQKFFGGNQFVPIYIGLPNN